MFAVHAWMGRRQDKLPRYLAAIAALWLGALLTGCERGPTDSSASGFRGTGMNQVSNRRAVDAEVPNNVAPEILKPARVREGAPLAGTTYKNVQILREQTLGEFGRTMNAITAWVSPKQSCDYCHVQGDFASDAKYTKIVARRMLQMVQHVNKDWQPHIGDTGITCYTCHRGNPIPKQFWFKQAQPANPNNLLANRTGQNRAAPEVGLTAMPVDAFEEFLGKTQLSSPVRIVPTTALRNPVGVSAVQAERTYSLMIHISKSLGVNCTFCHNSRSFAAWPESTPKRTTAWHGLNMARDINAQFMEPLAPAFPPSATGRLGPQGDTAKVHCATCHQGINKPLYGAQTARYYPALWPRPQPVAPAAAASAAPAPAPAAPVNEAEAAAMAAAKSTPAAPAASATAVAAASAPAPAAAATASAATAVAAAPAAPVAPAAPALPPGTSPDCALLAAAASNKAKITPESAVYRQVVGSGRLQFYAAPSLDCRMNGVFILAGEPGEVGREADGWSLLWYTNPRTGGTATGWVQTARLALITEAQATALLKEGARGMKAVPGAAVASAAAPAAAASAPVAVAAAKAPSARASAPVAVQTPTAAETSAALATVGADLNCIELAFDALQRSRPVEPGTTEKRVTGNGPLPFYWAPDARCRMDGVAIAVGDPVEGDRELAGYTAVWFRNPRTGAEAIGWVSSARLEAGAPGEVPAPR